MTPWQRKARTEAILRKRGIPLNPGLPCVESEEETELRTPEEVGTRIVCLSCVVSFACNPSKTFYKEYLKEHGLWDHLTPEEVTFLLHPWQIRQNIVNFTWRIEALFLLLWAVGLIETLAFPACQSDNEGLESRLPSLKPSPWPFIRGVTLRSKSEILDASDLIYRIHWAIVQARVEGQPPPSGVDPEVVQEWHHAINWLTKYEDVGWDETPTDT